MMRLYAKKTLSLSLSDHGLVHVIDRVARKGSGAAAAKKFIPNKKIADPNQQPIVCETEQDIFRALHVPYIPPNQRETVPAIFM
jgi:hypothetical protein